MVKSGFKLFSYVNSTLRFLKTRFTDENPWKLLTALGRNNTGTANSNINRKNLRPWSIAAFIFNFSNDETRIAYRNKIAQITTSPLYYKTAIEKNVLQPLTNKQLSVVSQSVVINRLCSSSLRT